MNYSNFRRKVGLIIIDVMAVRKILYGILNKNTENLLVVSGNHKRLEQEID